MHDSAVASVRPRARHSSSTISSIDRSSSENRYFSSGSRSAPASSSAAASAPSSTTRSTWISKSRAQIVASTPSRSPPASASARATADSLAPKKRSTRRPGGGARASRARIGSVSSARGHSRCSSPGGPGSTTSPRRRSRARTPARCPRARARSRLRAASPACSRLPRSPCRGAPSARRTAVRCPRSRSPAPRRAPSRGRRRARRAPPSVVVGRPEAAGGDTEVRCEPLRQRGRELLLAVADDHDPRRLERRARAPARRGTGRSGRFAPRARARCP